MLVAPNFPDNQKKDLLNKEKYKPVSLSPEVSKIFENTTPKQKNSYKKN